MKAIIPIAIMLCLSACSFIPNPFGRSADEPIAVIEDPVQQTSPAIDPTTVEPYASLYSRIAALESLSDQSEQAVDLLIENIEQKRKVLSLTQPFTNAAP